MGNTTNMFKLKFISLTSKTLTQAFCPRFVIPNNLITGT